MSNNQRAFLNYQNKSSRFTKRNVDFSNQYCKIYNIRLEKMGAILEENILKKWKKKYTMCKLHKLAEQNSAEKYVVVGTLFKDQKLKPSILKQLAETNQLVPQPVYAHCTDESDVLYIEDEMQRYEIEGCLNGEKLVTGITCAILASDIGKGKIKVFDYCFADYRSQIEQPILQDDFYIVFLSGLDLIHIEKSLLSLQLFTNWISGVLGDLSNVKVSNIVRLIVAGNSIQMDKKKQKHSLSLTSRTSVPIETIETVKTLDVLLDNWCQFLDVDVMPGENDPSNHILPQQSMHRCMFPNSSLYKSLHHVSNPYEFELGGLRILGTSGQPVLDVMKYCEIADPLEVMENCLIWNHLAPTAPDTLGCYPFYDNDPFILEDCPHVIFTGNQEKYDTKLCRGGDGQVVRLISIPQYSKTFTACVLNLRNLDCNTITFKI